MDAVIPFPMGPHRADWADRAGWACLERLVRMAGAPGPVTRVFVVTDAPELFDGLEGALVVRALSPGRQAPDLLPHGSAWARDALAARGEAQDGPALYMNPRNPFLTAETLTAALTAYARSNFPILLDTAEPKDHPCQFLTPVAVEETGLLLLFEPHPETLPWLPPAWRGVTAVTRPIAKAWADDPPLRQMLYENRSHGRAATERVSDGGTPPPGTPAWVREDRTLARLVLPAPSPDADGVNRAGGNFLREEGDLELSLMHGAGQDFTLRCRRHSGSLALLRLIPFGGSHANALPYMLLAAPESSHPLRVDPQVTGYVYVLLDYDASHAMSHPLSFEAEGCPWRFDPATGVNVNAYTGTVLAGRQDWPHALRLNRSLAVGSWEDLLRAEDLLARKRACLHLMSHDWPFDDDRLTIAQIQALMAAEELA